MMEGITVLSQSNVYTITNIAIAHIFPGLIAAFLGSMIAIFLFEHNYNVAGVIVGLCGLVGLASLIAGTSMPQEFSHIQYKVLIGEEVNLVDFTEQYEILNQEGLIFTIKELEKEN